ncbi:MAG: toprim domain-containing protein [Moraxellaceae bacterium]|nr:toprim domain-containing protein [Moraxellaceae bacterium]
MLAGNVPALAAHLLPAGHRDGGHWRCGGVDGSPGQSLAIHLHGDKAGVWHDFATGETGDALDLVAAVLFRGSTRDAMAWARRWLGVGGGTAPPPPSRPAPLAAQAAPAADDADRRRKALALFLSGQERIAGTPADGYLAGRGIVLAELARQPRALRFHPECWCQEARRPLPAMLAAITDGAGQHVGTHRTWLARDGYGMWHKAPLRDPKKTLGRYAGGFIPLWRGASGKALREAPAGEALAMAEGIETALSVALACPELRVVAAVALANMGSVILPASVAHVILCADNDADNPKAAAMLERAADRFVAQGRDVRIARPPVGKDFNDTLRAEMPG